MVQGFGDRGGVAGAGGEGEAEAEAEAKTKRCTEPAEVAEEKFF